LLSPLAPALRSNNAEAFFFCFGFKEAGDLFELKGGKAALQV
jgi:hypothetical protein